MILQPLVENAVRHSIALRASGGAIDIGARRLDSVLEIEISDDGPGVAPEEFREGVGLSNIRARLQQLYGDSQTMRLGRAFQGGFCVTLSVPAEIDARPDR